jgi:hypothetical protein
MPINAIVTFTFYRLVAWFNDRHAHVKAMQTRGQRWAPKQTTHLTNAKERANRHEVQCFNEELGKYEVTTMGGITSDGEVRPSRTHVVLLDAFSCGCGKPIQYHICRVRDQTLTLPPTLFFLFLCLWLWPMGHRSIGPYNHSIK